MKVLVVQLCPAFCDHMDFPARFSRPWNSPGKNTGVGCHFLLRGYLCHPGIKPGSPALQADSLMLSQVIVNNIILLTYVFTMPTASPINKLIFVCVCVRALSQFNHVQLCDPRECSLQGSSVHGILQESGMGCQALLQRISQPRVQTHTSYVSCIGRQLLYHPCHLGNPSVCVKVKVSLPHCRRILYLAKPFVCVSCDRYMCLCLSNELTEINDKFQEYCRPVSFSTWKMPSANRNYLISSFLFCLSFISFLLLLFCLIALAKASSTVLKEG